MENKKKKWNVIVQGLGLMERLSPHFLICCVGQAALKALSPFINIYLSARMVNDLLRGQGMRHMLALIVLMAALNLACQGFGAWMDRLVSIKQSILSTQYHWTLNRKMMELSYADVESHTVQALREKIRQMEQVNNMGLWNLVFPIRAAIQCIFSIIFAFAIFCSVFTQKGTGSSGSAVADYFCSPWASIAMAALILANIIVSLWTVSRSTKKVFGAYAGLVPLNQVYTYYLENYIDSYHSGKDIRLYDQKSLICSEMEHLLANGRMPMKRLKGIEFRYNGISALMNFGMNLFIYLMVGLRTWAGLFPAGNIVQYIGGINQFITGFTTLSGQLTLLGANVEALDLIFQYLDREGTQGQRGRISREEAEKIPAIAEIQFRNVSFVYPDTDKRVLEDLSFSIKAGEKLAVVGENGSGKTTMIKLLCRLYDVGEGEILLNGIDIRELDSKAYQGLFGVVFQDFQLFPFGLGQNLAGNTEYEEDKARAALEEAGFGMRLEGMDLETSLYKDFDPSGVEVSGGEAQKIAIARALYKQAPILVLDEPTAALDPQAEYEVYKNLNFVSRNRTSIFISHRMSSCRFCDRILVFDKGKLVQEGTHEELLRDLNGKYYQLWRSQEQYYQ